MHTCNMPTCIHTTLLDMQLCFDYRQQYGNESAFASLERTHNALKPRKESHLGPIEQTI